MGSFVGADANGGNVSTLTGVSWPVHTGDDLAILVWTFLNTSTHTDPSGFTLVGALDDGSCRSRVYKRTPADMTGSESGDVSLVCGTINRQTAVLYVVSGFTDVAGSASFAETVTGTSHDCPQVTFTGNCNTLVAVSERLTSGTTNATAPTGYTEHTGSEFGTGGTGGSYTGVADDGLTTAVASPVDPGAWTGHVSGGTAVTWTLALTPSGLTAVGKDIALQWDTRAALGDAVQVLWDARQAVGDPVALQWDTRAIAAKSVQALWDARSAVGDTVQLVWDVQSALAVVGKDLGLLWDTRAALGDTVQVTWDTRAAAGKSTQLIWDLHSVLGDELGLIWATRIATGDTVQALWDVRQQVGDAIELQWATRAAAGDAVQLVWDVASSLIVVTPPERTLTVLSETRVDTLASDSRTLTVLSETRTMEV